MSAYTYGLSSPMQQLQQARHELEQLDRLQNTALPFERKNEPAYLARTIAVTIWHITDAVVATPEPKFVSWRAAHAVRNLPDFQEQIRNRSAELTLCWELANGSKHQRQDNRKKAPPQVEETTMSAAPATFAVAFPFRGGRLKSIAPR
jgi:hypothetical protein